jgi:hypothetical protein
MLENTEGAIKNVKLSILNEFGGLWDVRVKK